MLIYDNLYCVANLSLVANCRHLEGGCLMEVQIYLFSNSFPGKLAVAACKPLIASRLAGT